MHLKDKNERWFKEEGDIRRSINRFFQGLYSTGNLLNIDRVTQHIPNYVSDEKNEKLTATVTDEEIKEVAFNLRSLKAPGPNGLSGVFFQRH